MTNHDFAHLMRRMTEPRTGAGMGALGLFSVVSIGAWIYWRGEVKS